MFARQVRSCRAIQARAVDRYPIRQKMHPPIYRAETDKLNLNSLVRQEIKICARFVNVLLDSAVSAPLREILEPTSQMGSRRGAEIAENIGRGWESFREEPLSSVLQISLYLIWMRKMTTSACHKRRLGGSVAGSAVAAASAILKVKK
jgi:hypothetical protein